MGIFDIDPISNMHWFYCHWFYITCIFQHGGNDYNIMHNKSVLLVNFICDTQSNVPKRIWKEKNDWDKSNF